MKNKVTVKYILEKRGWPWSKWRKTKEWTEDVDKQDICKHKFTYQGRIDQINTIRKCKKCGLEEQLQGFRNPYNQSFKLAGYPVDSSYPVWVEMK